MSPNAAMPGRLVDVGGYRLHLHETGFGATTILLESGNGGSVLDWALVQPELSRVARVCSYDRAGCGWSDRGRRPRTCLDIVDELGVLLRNAEVLPPYLFVGWSFGGYVGRVFASRFPDQTSGVLLVDTPHEDLLDPPTDLATEPWLAACAKARIKRRRFLTTLRALARARLLYPLAPLLAPRTLDPLARKAYSMLARSPTRYETALEELEATRTSVAQVRSATFPRAVPLTILSAADSIGSLAPRHLPHAIVEVARRNAKSLQRRMADLSEHGRFIEVASTSHAILFDKPLAIVKAATEFLSN